MTVIVDGTNGLTFPDVSVQATSATNATNISSGTMPYARFPTGVVLQVVSTTNTSAFSTSSSTFVTTGMSASITPRFSASKILISFSTFNILQGGNMVAAITVYRGGTSLNSVGFSSTFGPTAVTTSSTGSGVYLDSPATTNSTTYTLYFSNPNNNGTVQLNSASGLVSIVLMEIAG
jgi:hypothetical protein